MPSKSESFVFKTPYPFKKITKLKRKPCAKEGENHANVMGGSISALGSQS